ncbi:hypothetical protein [Actinosynnema sp. ALI-1.44]|nr:hypothetical protein [Actinosynnema sp. ALI-1.44]
MDDLIFTIMLIGMFILIALCIRDAQRLRDAQRDPAPADEPPARTRLP